jgi:hypothetical protein
MEKISTSAEVKFSLIVTIFTFWALIQSLIILIFSEEHLLLGTLLFLVSVFFCIKFIAGEVKMNQTHLLLNYFTKKNRSVFEGFYFKLLWETVQYETDLEATIDSSITETFPTQDGSMTVTVSIMSKPESGIGETETERSLKMAKYVKFKKDSIKEMQEARAKEVMRERFGRVTCEEAKSLKHEDILKKDDFDKISDDLSIRIIECPVKDVDYNEEVQRARNALSKASALAGMVNLLVKEGKYTKKEAKAIAPLSYCNQYLGTTCIGVK